ncbi:MAG: hypothetical protein PHU23_03945 [Dehalococcoidales bacterium]|nr:hypothetical protein [Dehalococcoidales bacterium]
MEPITIIIGIVVLLILLFVAVKIIKSCLPKILIALIILGGLGYLAYWYFSTH